MTPPDLTSWQRLAPMALLFLIINGSIKFIRENLYVFLGAGAGVAFVEHLGLREAVLGIAGLLLAAVISAMVYHRRFRFRLEEDAVRVRKGLVHKTDLRVRFGRIQNVSISQPFYFRPFGLVRFSLETPGGTETEVELPGIRQELADAMRDEIARQGLAEAVVDDDAAETDEDQSHLHVPGPGRLFAHGLVSNQVWVLAGIVGWLVGTLNEQFEGLFERSGINASLRQIIEFGVVGGLILILLLLVALILLSGLISLVRFHGYALRDLGDRLVARYGLLDRREQTLRREKLTGLTLSQTIGGRLLGLWYLTGRQASSAEIEIDPRARRFLVPGLDDDDRRLVGRLMPDVALPAGLTPISRRFRWLFWSRLTLLVAIGTALLWLPWFVLPFAQFVVPVALVLVLYLIHRRWHSWGWSEQDGFCWVQQGLFGRRQDGFFLEHVQQIRVIRSPYLRRHNLATLRFTLPHGEVSIPFLELEVAAALANRAAFVAETAVAHRI